MFLECDKKEKEEENIDKALLRRIEALQKSERLAYSVCISFEVSSAMRSA